MTVLELETPHGPARAHVHPVESPRAALVLGHGAGGGVESRDLVAVTEVAMSDGIVVALVEQPYRVAGRRSPAPARQLEAAWLAVVEHVTAEELHGLPLIVGGRSLGARVACRTAPATGAVAVLCLAFPLVPPRRASGKPPVSRLPELEEVPGPGARRSGRAGPVRDAARRPEPDGRAGAGGPQPADRSRRGGRGGTTLALRRRRLTLRPRPEWLV